MATHSSACAAPDATASARRGASLRGSNQAIQRYMYQTLDPEAAVSFIRTAGESYAAGSDSEAIAVAEASRQRGRGLAR